MEPLQRRGITKLYEPVAHPLDGIAQGENGRCRLVAADGFQVCVFHGVVSLVTIWSFPLPPAERVQSGHGWVV